MQGHWPTCEPHRLSKIGKILKNMYLKIVWNTKKWSSQCRGTDQHVNHTICQPELANIDSLPIIIHLVGEFHYHSYFVSSLLTWFQYHSYFVGFISYVCHNYWLISNNLSPRRLELFVSHFCDCQSASPKRGWPASNHCLQFKGPCQGYTSCTQEVTSWVGEL